MLYIRYDGGPCATRILPTGALVRAHRGRFVPPHQHDASCPLFFPLLRPHFLLALALALPLHPASTARCRGGGARGALDGEVSARTPIAGRFAVVDARLRHSSICTLRAWATGYVTDIILTSSVMWNCIWLWG
ncbi:hypothetical protein DENSPDRAFT_855296 [Dentipellis sp. KUC8613]|nr:hypothetical protein DENSPDRAFT_855296 [Dentipellis sp. KUC8613]